MRVGYARDKCELVVLAGRVLSYTRKRPSLDFVSTVQGAWVGGSQGLTPVHFLA